MSEKTVGKMPSNATDVRAVANDFRADKNSMQTHYGNTTAKANKPPQSSPNTTTSAAKPSPAI
ncbi:hypothetical protein [Prevotella sp. OH937_COT-195]|uniref:hypothetical protein n=1 Tax=Prevotella sp. OH937_COT-195 TaxID=2491051 RepID=UPI000F64FD17|nr:hypothetical protein [Prevotella sp. OH937_COT-195]RRC96721.1 hypothetical protein EII32_11080 [Prevotella sp. OH937_COT-195]